MRHDFAFLVYVFFFYRRTSFFFDGVDQNVLPNITGTSNIRAEILEVSVVCAQEPHGARG